jgi:hypothetical protein
MPTNLPILAVSVMCQNMNISNLGTLITCFIETNLFGDLGLFALCILSIFVGFIVRYNLPGNILLPISVALTYTLYIMSGNQPFFLAALIVVLVMNGAVLALGILNHINR